MFGHLAALEHFRARQDVLVAAVCTGADHDLLDALAFDFADGHDVVRHARFGDERFELREIDGDLVGVLGVCVGFELLVVLLAAEPAEVIPRLLVGREDRGGRAELRPHVGDRRSLGDRQRLDAGAGVLEDLADAALDGEASQHLKDDILRGGPPFEFAFKSDVDDFRHLDVVGAAAHGDGDIETARADRKLAKPTGGRRVAVRTQQCLAGRGEVLLVDVVTDAVAGPRKVRTEGARGDRRKRWSSVFLKSNW